MVDFIETNFLRMAIKIRLWTESREFLLNFWFAQQEPGFPFFPMLWMLWCEIFEPLKQRFIPVEIGVSKNTAITLPETNSSPQKMDGWKTIVSFGGTILSGANS